ncbi:MAG: class I SAM-dependent methyltransferase, partial [Phycisphaerales bacterium JB041]
MTTLTHAGRTETWRRMLHDHAADHKFVRARFGQRPEPDYADRVLASHDTAPWAVGSIGVLDAMVLRDLVHAVRPRRIIEIGTAAGTSALLLARAMRECGCAGGGGPVVHTYDLHPWCYFDRTRAVGSAIDEAEPETAAMIRRRVGVTSIDAGMEFAGRGIEMAFVDADHRHPAPVVDVLALLPAMAPGGWIVLHDTNLPEEADRYERLKGVCVDWKQHGAKWLFDSWEHEKLTLPVHKNIGAIRVPAGAPLRADDFCSCTDNPA